MLTERIDAIFQFIDYLHSNIEGFKQFDTVMEELYFLLQKRNKLSPRKNFADKLEYDNVQADLEQKADVITKNITQVISAKALELNICDLNRTETLWNWNISEIHKLRENFTRGDVPTILLYKTKYFEFRIRTKHTYFYDIFFSDLDEILKELFDFFKEGTENEFEVFETKTIHVNSIREAVEQFQNGATKFSLPIDFLNFSNAQQNTYGTLPTQQTSTNAQMRQKTHAEQQEAEAEANQNNHKQDLKPSKAKAQDDIFKEIIDRCRLNHFLSVPDADLVIENAFWHDENDEPIDCNIYHPKYGYPGFKTYSQDIIAASFGTRYSYKDYETKETIYAPYYLQVLCVDHEGKFTNRDGKKVVKVPFTQTHRKRLADTTTDFETILRREFQANELGSSPETKAVFRTEIHNHVQELIELHKANSSYAQGTRDINLLAIADRFLKFLKQPFVATHREIILAHIYKVKAGLETERTAAQWKAERGDKAKQAYYTLLKQSQNYKELRKGELKNVVDLLKEFPEALKLAVKDLDEIERL
jgi:hypothetical protein